MGAVALSLVTDIQESKSLNDRVREAGIKAVEALCHNFSEDIENMDFEELSNHLLTQGKTITQTMLNEYLDTKASAPHAVLKHPCPHCGKRIPCKESRKRTIETRHGKLTFERPYFYCKSCKMGFFPMDDELKLSAKAKQADLSRLAIKFLAEMPYQTASELFKETTGCEYSNHCMHGLAEHMGEELEIQDVLPSKEDVESIIQTASGNFRRPVVVVSADGAHEPCRPKAEGTHKQRGPGYWREAKGFRIYLVTQERITQIASWHQIMDEKAFGESLEYAATLLPMDKIRIGLIGDGAPWLWSHFERIFPSGKPILDYYHVSEHIHKVAEVQYGSQTQTASDWAEATMTRLWAGEVGSVIWGLQRMKPPSSQSEEEIRKLIGYLEKNEEKINFASCKKGGYPIGSGAIESANKFICHVRLKRSGAWWYEENANTIMKIRCAKFNGHLDKIIDKYKGTAGRRKRKKAQTSL